MESENKPQTHKNDTDNTTNISVAADIPNPQPSSNAAKEQPEKWYSKLKKPILPHIAWNEIFGMLGVFIGGGLCYIYWSQLQVMSLQLQEMQGSSSQTSQLIASAAHQASETHDLAVAAKNQAEASKKISDRALAQIGATSNLAEQARRQADTASSAWKEIQKQTLIEQWTAVNAERAWLGVDVGKDPDHPIQVDELSVKLNPVQLTVTASYRIKNFGHGPAFEVRTQGFITTEERIMVTNATDECQMVRVTEALGVFPPHGRILFPGDSFINFFGGVPDHPFVIRPFPNDTLLYFVGCVAYTDQFEIPHWTRFCFTNSPYAATNFAQLNKDTPLVPYVTYNDTDEIYQKVKRNPTPQPPK